MSTNGIKMSGRAMEERWERSVFGGSLHELGMPSKIKSAP